MNDLEVVEPYPNEILYSWLSRMFYWYGFQNQPRSNIRTFNTMLFGINSRSIINILIPHDLGALVESIELPNSKYFCSVDAMIKSMTLIPFYCAFINTDEKKKLNKCMIRREQINLTKSLLGIKNVNSKAPDFKLKFCYQCWSENRYMYFDIEHQVNNNYTCYKHNTRLQYICVNSSDYFLFDNTWINQYSKSPFCINLYDNFMPCYTQISSMIHEIFINGFRDDIILLKSKIRKKMLDLGYMREDYNFLSGFQDFWLGYDKYNILNIDKKEIINVIYSTNKNPNPIAYLTLIIFLFGTLKSYYEYEIDEQSTKLIFQKPSRVIALTQQQKPCGLIYYKDLTRDIYNERYSILRKTDRKFYEIKCNECDHVWIIPQYYIRSELVNCPNCKKKSNI